jgi:16S rRNA (guanine(966)-N(2))-methyltransferase RsmD
VGIEALSRGAAHVVFVERDERACRLIERNLRGCGVSGGYAIVARTHRQAASGGRLGAFDLVFLDPPYDSDELTDALDVAAGCVAPGGLLVLEHAARRESPDHVHALSRVRTIVAGDSALSFYRPVGPRDLDVPEGGDR